MKILTISGSARGDSSNTRLLKHLYSLTTSAQFHFTQLPKQLPLFTADRSEDAIPSEVKAWRKELKDSDGVIICIPEYTYNMPAIIKNALEWVTASGELAGKKVLAITFTPHAPRGEKAMQSLLWSLQALDANILASLPLYQTEIAYSDDGELKGDGAEVLKEAIQLFL